MSKYLEYYILFRVLIIYTILYNKEWVSEWVSDRVKVALRPSNAKMLYMDEKSTEKGEIKEQNNRKVKGK